MVEYDLIIRGGIIVDGTGAPPFKADIGVRNGLIVKIGDLSTSKANVLIDAKTLYVTPGFIDIHNHSDLSIFNVPTADNYVLQGVTTLVIGNCGASPAPISDVNRELIKELVWGVGDIDVNISWETFSEYLDRLNNLRKSVNIAALVGHGALRSAVLGFDSVAANERDIKSMKELLIDALNSGAFGMSLGLIYVPSMYADRRELLELSKILAKYNALLAVHMRDEALNLLDSIFEILSLAIESSVKVEISHLKAVGKASWGKAELALKLLEDYVRRGYDVSADAYPYEATSTFLSAILPSWVRVGGVKKLLSRLGSRDVIEKLRRELMGGVMGTRKLGWSDIVISLSPSHREVEGLSLEDIAKNWGLDPLEVTVKLLLDDRGLTEMLAFGMNPEEVNKVITHPLVAIGSDGMVRRLGLGKPHPRNYGTFPKVIARYVRELKLISLEEAIRKMTSLPARKLGLWDRGIVRPNFKADLVVFDMNTINDKATYENPHRYPIGIKYVIVNGEVVVDDGVHIGKKPGLLLRHQP